MVCLLVSCRGAALVEVFVEIEGQTAFSHDHQSWLEVWTDDVDRLLAGGFATAALAQVQWWWLWFVHVRRI